MTAVIAVSTDGSGVEYYFECDSGNGHDSGWLTDPNYTGSAGGTLVISPATATVALGGLAQTYDGASKPASATTWARPTRSTRGSSASTKTTRRGALSAAISDLQYSMSADSSRSEPATRWTTATTRSPH